MRTAAVSALAMERLLASPPSRITLLGAGAQAQCHLDMLAERFPMARITLWNRTIATARNLAARYPGIEVARQLAEAIAQADCILCCTSAPTPILGLEAVRSGRLIIQAGFHEVAFEAIAASDVVAVDAWGAFADRSAKSLFQMYRAGRFRPKDVAVDLAALAAEHWRAEPGTSVYFSSFGLNFFDIALAARVLQTAAESGLGQTLEPFSHDGVS
jgi:ornithine cyclodeaminase